MTQLVTTLDSLQLSEHTEKIRAFHALFLTWNRRINLSAARTDLDLESHTRDSLHVVPHLASSPRVLDVGSGGGFPVVIAAICLPGVSFTALEPTHKKRAFLSTAARELSLLNLTSFSVRVEDHATRDYDAAMSRATFDLREWLLLGATLVRPGGIVIGFEATQRDDLPVPLDRHPYTLDDKTRAIVIHRP